MREELVARIEERLEKLEKQLLEKYLERTPRSRGLYEKASHRLPGGVNYHIRYYSPYPVFIDRALDKKVWDVDGNEYTDYWMGHGAHILGHAPDIVVEAVNEAVKRGTHFGYMHELVVDYAELLTRIIPGGLMVRFAQSGTEANMYALRLARAYTGRKRVVKIQGGWHGAYNSLHYGVTPPYNMPESAGIVEECLKYVTAIPFNDLEAAERELRRGDVAAIILEPVLGAGGCIPAEREYLKGLRRLAEETGTLLVFDEVITGFRLAPGGAQEYYGVEADIVVLGKAVGGGCPGAGALMAKPEIMEYLDHLKKPNPRERSAFGGTFTGNHVTLSAGYALVSYLHRHRELYSRAEETWSWFRRRAEETCRSHGVDCYATGAGSMTGLHFTRRRPRDHAAAVTERWSSRIERVFHLYARVNNILYLTEHTIHFFPSFKHSREDAEALLEILDSFLGELAG